MTVAFKFLDRPLVIGEGEAGLLVIENTKLYRDTLSMLSCGGEEDLFVFSEDNVPFNFSQKGMFVSPLEPYLENKKLLTKLSAYFCDVADTELFEKTAEIKASLSFFAEKLAEMCEFDCDYTCIDDTHALINLFKPRPRADGDFAERFSTFLKLSSKYLKTKIFVVQEFRRFFTESETELIYKTLALEHISLLSIEYLQPAPALGERIAVIDRELCVIDSELCVIDSE